MSAQLGSLCFVGVRVELEEAIEATAQTSFLFGRCFCVRAPPPLRAALRSPSSAQPSASAAARPTLPGHQQAIPTRESFRLINLFANAAKAALPLANNDADHFAPRPSSRSSLKPINFRSQLPTKRTKAERPRCSLFLASSREKKRDALTWSWEAPRVTPLVVAFASLRRWIVTYYLSHNSVPVSSRKDIILRLAWLGFGLHFRPHHRTPPNLRSQVSYAPDRLPLTTTQRQKGKRE